MRPDEQSAASISTEVTPKRRPALLGLAVLGAGALVLLFALGPSASSAWVTVQTNLDNWQAWTGQHPVLALAAFFVVYAVAASLPLPVLTVMNLLAGALFGRTAGTAVAALGYTAGVTVAFLAARWLFRDRVQNHSGAWLRRVESGVARDGAFYLLTLRLMPSVPFFLVNVLMALTPMRTRTFALVSWLGVLPMTFLCAGVGTELAALKAPADVLSGPMIASLVALAVVPLIVRKLLRRGGHEAEAA